MPIYRAGSQMSAVLESKVQEEILRFCLERGGSAFLDELKERVSSLVKYRASAALSQNSIALERRGLVRRSRVGKRVLVEVEPTYICRLRRQLGIRAEFCLISGYTYNPDRPDDLTVLRNYVDAIEKLKAEGISVGRLVCFTTERAREMRVKHGIKPDPDAEVALNFEVYQSKYDELRQIVREVVEREVKDYDPILDITPLTKLFTDVLAEISEKFEIPRIYHFGPKLTWIRGRLLTSP